MARLILGVLALSLLAACGKKGEPSPPGPAVDITYPKSFPPPDTP